MFNDLDETLRQILIDDLPVKSGEIGIEFDQPKREWSARLSRPTVNLYLYDIRENAQLRNFQPQYAANGITSAARKRPPIRVDCQYIVTAWATDIVDEHRLMARAMQVFYRLGQIPPERLAGRLNQQPYALSTQVGSHDKLTNPAEVWSAMDNEVRPSLSLMVTLAMDPWEESIEPLVQQIRINTYQAEQITGEESDKTELGRGAFNVESSNIGGLVRDTNGNPVPYAKVALKDTGFMTQTNAEGQFRFSG
ncbi:MAG: Pvc16 family protein, partial [Anaerolineae bacterium]